MTLIVVLNLYSLRQKVIVLCSVLLLETQCKIHFMSVGGLCHLSDKQ